MKKHAFKLNIYIKIAVFMSLKQQNLKQVLSLYPDIGVRDDP